MASKDEAKHSFFEGLYTTKSTDANEIASGLFLGAANAAEDKAAMLKRRITHVLIAHPALPEKHPKHFKYRRVPIPDVPDANILELLPDALDFMVSARQSGGRLFVYCMKGISRSSSMVSALLMLERGLSFEEAWKTIEQKRPVVYPNVGFQQQLRYFERLLAGTEGVADMEQRLQQLRAAVPRGPLEGPKAPLQIKDAIGGAMEKEFAEVEALAERIFLQPQLLQSQELWKRHGLYFENLHKYKALPSDSALLGRASATAGRLRTLPKIFSESLKGVKLGLAVAGEIEAWATFAGPRLAADGAGAAGATAGEARPLVAQAYGEASSEEGEGASRASDETQTELGEQKSKSDKKAKKQKKEKKDQKEGRDKEAKMDDRKGGDKDKKDKKLDKKAEKAAEKAEKAAKKAGKLAAKLEKAAAQMEREAESSRTQAEEAAEKAIEAELQVAAIERQMARSKRKANDDEGDD